MQNEILITPHQASTPEDNHGYNFTLPYAPCTHALGRLKQLCPGYRHETGKRWVSAANLAELIETLRYWFEGDARGDGQNRHGRVPVRVVEPGAAADDSDGDDWVPDDFRAERDGGGDSR